MSKKKRSYTAVYKRNAVKLSEEKDIEIRINDISMMKGAKTVELH